MKQSEKERFATLLKDVLAFYRQDLSRFALGVWWQACQSFDFEQVSGAMTAHCMDAERGQWAPKPADIVRQLQGTHSDRSLIAWGKVLDAAQRVGAYTSVAFDDGLIHAVIEDVGGWPAVCRTESDELPFLQKRFCEAYRAYARRPSVGYPAILTGEHDRANAARGFKTSPPALIGDPKLAIEVSRSASEKTRITSAQEAVGNLLEDAR